MNLDTFHLQLFISFLLGGLVIALQTLVAERVNPNLRGIILTLPNTVVLGLFFIGLSKSPIDAVEAARLFPLSQIGIYFFITLFAFFIRWGLLPACLTAYSGWTFMAYISLHLPDFPFKFSVIISVLLAFPFYFLVKTLPQNKALDRHPINAKNLLSRALLAGLIVSITLYLSKTLGNTWGGIFSAFPSVLTSTFLIYYFAQGGGVIPSLAQGLFFPGSIGFCVYVGLVIGLYPIYGIWLGTLFAYLGVIAFLVSWRKLALVFE